MGAEDLDRDKLENALTALGEEARAAGKVVDLAVYGGSCLLLTSDFRIATKDVDAVIEHDETFLMEAADRVGERLGLPPGWLNDGVRTYLAPNDEAARRYFGSYPGEAEPGLRVFVPTPEYMLAMKLMAMRIDTASGGKDFDDIINLVAITGTERKEELVALAAGFYPEARVSGKLALALEGLWKEVERRDRDVPRQPPTWHPRRGGG